MFGVKTGMDFGAVTVGHLPLRRARLRDHGSLCPLPHRPSAGHGRKLLLRPVRHPSSARRQASPNAWQVALGAVFLSGLLFLLLSLVGVREMVMNSISPSMKNAIAVGIGLFIAFIGLQNAGLDRPRPWHRR